MEAATRAPSRAPSSLECLPVEILQTIFLHSLEFNLPRATIYLSRALSDPIIYSWLIRLACSSANPSARRNFFTDDYLPPPLDFFNLSTSQRSLLQTSIYECRWFTLALLREVQKGHITHGLRKKCRDFIFTPEDTLTLTHKLDAEFHKSRAEKRGRGGKGDLVLRASTPAGDRKLALWLDAGAFQIRPLRSFYIERDVFRLPAFSHNVPARVPDRLLCSPWTEEKLELLRLLAAEAYIDDDEDHARSSKVLRGLIRGREFGVFVRLARMRIASRVGWHFEQWPVGLEHFRLALRCADGEGDVFVRFLVEERWEDIPNGQAALMHQLLGAAGLTQRDRT